MFEIKGRAEGCFPGSFCRPCKPKGLRGLAKLCFARRQKGQLSAEMIGISAVIMILFLIVVLIVFQRGLFTNLIGNVNQNTQLCNRLSRIIADFNSNPGYSETTVELVEKVKIDARSITVNPENCPNCQYCYYSGTVDGISGATTEISLPKGKYIIGTDDRYNGVKFSPLS